MTNIMICGSRDATLEMLQYARNCVRNAFRQGWTVGAGDAIGVDAAVAQAAIELFDLHPDPKADKAENAHLWTLCTVFGLAPQPRHGVMGAGIQYRQLSEYMQEHRFEEGTENRRYLRIHRQTVRVTSYEQRDRLLVDAADNVMCIWNGKHRPSGEPSGTEMAYRYALSLGKQAWLKDFSKKGVV